MAKRKNKLPYVYIELEDPAKLEELFLKAKASRKPAQFDAGLDDPQPHALEGIEAVAGLQYEEGAIASGSEADTVEVERASEGILEGNEGVEPEAYDREPEAGGDFIEREDFPLQHEESQDSDSSDQAQLSDEGVEFSKEAVDDEQSEGAPDSGNLLEDGSDSRKHRSSDDRELELKPVVIPIFANMAGIDGHGFSADPEPGAAYCNDAELQGSSGFDPVSYPDSRQPTWFLPPVQPVFLPMKPTIAYRARPVPYVKPPVVVRMLPARAFSAWRVGRVPFTSLRAPYARPVGMPVSRYAGQALPRPKQAPARGQNHPAVAQDARSFDEYAFNEGASRHLGGEPCRSGIEQVVARNPETASTRSSGAPKAEPGFSPAIASLDGRQNLPTGSNACPEIKDDSPSSKPASLSRASASSSETKAEKTSSIASDEPAIAKTSDLPAASKIAGPPESMHSTPEPVSGQTASEGGLPENWIDPPESSKAAVAIIAICIIALVLAAVFVLFFWPGVSPFAFGLPLSAADACTVQHLSEVQSFQLQYR